jgi:flagellar L-ring protein precursor FlgH
MKIYLLSLLFVLSSCASYVQNLHNQIDRENYARKQARQKKYYGPYGSYRGVPYGKNDKRPITNPVTIGNAPNTASTSNTRNLPPENIDQYGKKRVKVDDLKDNDGSGSLWSGKTGDSFLFVTNNVKRQGDIVIIEVLKDFKNKITSELKTAFPDRRRRGKKGASAPEEKIEEPGTGPSTTAEGGGEKKVYDKISATVVEEVNKDYLLIRGRKEILYKKAKRFIEVQALVSRKDISDNDAVASNRILEPKIMVLRY